ncbi:MAG: PDZ domain-containing protein [candidate division Zixibacteria bacterium]|nr:PDZ domain-containing protein [candidate division Zixibacteria bacterium]
MQIEVSFGINTSDQEERYLGTIVTEDGLVIFDGTDIASDNMFSSFSGLTVKTTPTKIEIITLDGISYDGKLLGFDRFTKLGFINILAEDNEKFTPVKFNKHHEFRIGEWLALFMLMPEFITPSLSADIGMVSNLVESPEPFPLTVGFNSMQLASVLFNESLEAVGILGTLMDPSSGSANGGSMMGSFGSGGIPMLGVITGERIEELIAAPPTEGEIERGWLGISLQALTEDIAEFWQLDLAGGIIVNEIIRNSPADKSGLKVGDIIYEVNGQPVEVDREEKIAVFQRLIANLGPEAAVELEIMRLDQGSTELTKILVNLEKAPISPTEAADFKEEELELTVRDLVFADYMIYNLDSENFKGVVVSGLTLGGPASIGGLLIGDIIQRIGPTEIESVDDAKKVLREISTEQPREVIFFIWRRNQTMFVNVKPTWN